MNPHKAFTGEKLVVIVVIPTVWLKGIALSEFVRACQKPF